MENEFNVGRGFEQREAFLMLNNILALPDELVRPYLIAWCAQLGEDLLNKGYKIEVEETWISRLS